MACTFSDAATHRRDPSIGGTASVTLSCKVSQELQTDAGYLDRSAETRHALLQTICGTWGLQRKGAGCPWIYAWRRNVLRCDAQKASLGDRLQCRVIVPIMGRWCVCVRACVCMRAHGYWHRKECEGIPCWSCRLSASYW